jgi:AcrR family transcriptional regulator
VLDAARASIVDVGWKRTTLTDIARRAGVSRMTIYRRWPDTQALLADLLVREWSTVVETATPTEGHARSRIVHAARAIARALREDELFGRILELDAELLLPYLVERRGRNQQMLLDLLTAEMTAGQSDGSVRAGAADLLAEAVLLAAQGFVVSARSEGRDQDRWARLDDEMTELVERYLAP